MACYGHVDDPVFDAVEFATVSMGEPAPVDACNFADGEVMFVEDTGRGIPEADRDWIYESGNTKAADGTGLGLSIVRRIARAHDWTVSVSDGPDGGTRFEFSVVNAA